MSIFSTSNLNVTLNQKNILKKINISLEKGSLTAIIGPNGSGKTTLLKTLCKVQNFSNGEITLKGNSINNYTPSELAKNLSWVPSHTSIPFDFTCFDIVLLGRFPHHKGYPQKEDRRVVLKSLESVGMENFIHREFTTLSSGEANRILIARALAAYTDILFFDEPCANLDISVSLSLLKLFKDLCDKDHTICLSLHDINLAYRFSTHVIVLNNGELHAAGKTKEVLTPKLINELFQIHAKFVRINDSEEAVVTY